MGGSLGIDGGGDTTSGQSADSGRGRTESPYRGTAAFTGPLNSRIVLPVMLITVLATALSAFLIMGKFDRSLSEFELSRYAFVLGNVQGVFARDLNLGLDIDQIGNAQSVLERQASDDKGIVMMVLFDSHGRVLAQAGAKHIALVPGSWIGRKGEGGGRPWTMRDNAVEIAGVPLVNSFDQTVGGLALGYSLGPHYALLAKMGSKLWVAAVVIAVAAVLLSVLAASLLISRIQKALGTLSLELTDGGGESEDNSTSGRVRTTAQAALDDMDAVYAELASMKGGGGAGASP